MKHVKMPADVVGIPQLRVQMGVPPERCWILSMSPAHDGLPMIEMRIRNDWSDEPDDITFWSVNRSQRDDRQILPNDEIEAVVDTARAHSVDGAPPEHFCVNTDAMCDPFDETAFRIMFESIEDFGHKRAWLEDVMAELRIRWEMIKRIVTPSVMR